METNVRIERSLRHRDHALRLVVTEHAHGWKVREEEDHRVSHDVVHDDWHRVERDLWLFDLRAADLRQQGWTDCDAAPDSSVESRHLGSLR